MANINRINNNHSVITELIKLRRIKESPLVVVDVGAGGGFEPYWDCFGDAIKLIGFEPEKHGCEEVNKEGKGICYQTALSDDGSPKPLYVTAGLHSSGFYAPNMRFMHRFHAKENMDIVKKIIIATVNLDSFGKEHDIKYIDFIKMDAEGAELDILKGAEDYLKTTVLGVNVEVTFQEMHKGQVFFSEIDSYLRGLGFKLYDITPYRLQRLTTENTPPPHKYGQVVFGQALYMRDAVDDLISNADYKWDVTKVLKLMSLFSLFCLGDCVQELLNVAVQKGIILQKEKEKVLA